MGSQLEVAQERLFSCGIQHTRVEQVRTERYRQ
jgi:hypothetical protein